MSKTIKNITEFRAYLTTLETIGDVESVGDELLLKLKRSRTPATRLGCQMALDAIYVEVQNRRKPLTIEELEMTDDELLAELN